MPGVTGDLDQTGVPMSSSQSVGWVLLKKIDGQIPLHPWLFVSSYCSLFLQSRKIWVLDFPGGAMGKNPPANAGDIGSRPGPGRSHMLRSN